MERYDWQDRPDYREDRRYDRDRPLDESAYRGAYRLDTESNHHNQTTYGGFGSRPHPEERQQGGDYVYRRSRNLQDNDAYTENQYRQSYGNVRSGHPGNDDFGSRYGGSAGMQDSRHHYGGGQHEQERTHFGGGRGSNFNNDYGPDRYRHLPNENYGNMAGSLSFGYDGDYNSDPDHNRHYNPLSGEMRDYRDNYTQRHPSRYGPPDSTGSNPDYDRY